MTHPRHAPPLLDFLPPDVFTDGCRTRSFRGVPALEGRPAPASSKSPRRTYTGFFEPLTRYGRLPTSYLIQFDKRYGGHRKDRLTKLYQETAGLKAKDQLIHRSEQQWQFGGMNGQAQYRLGTGAEQHLENAGLLDHRTKRWMPATQVGPGDSHHDFFLNLAMASIEIAASKLPGLRFINHLEILKRASTDAQHANRPLKNSIPGSLMRALRVRQ